MRFKILLPLLHSVRSLQTALKQSFVSMLLSSSRSLSPSSPVGNTSPVTRAESKQIFPNGVFIWNGICSCHILCVLFIYTLLVELECYIPTIP